MAERLNDKPEQEINTSELEGIATERKAELEKSVERAGEKSPEKSVEDARHEVEKVAAEKEKTQEKQPKIPAERRKDTLPRTAKGRDASFKLQMKAVHAELSAPSRAFSKVIHNKAVEKASEAVGNTVARPNAILAGSLSALIITTGLYFWARYVGYPLSGFETIGAFIIGWLLGIIFDFTRIMITGKR